MTTTGEFFDHIFGEEGGFVRLALNTKESQRKFKESFFMWPEQKDRVASATSVREKGDVYFNPVLFPTKSGKKQPGIKSRVSWVDVDLSQPTTPADVAPPALVVSSGTPGHYHGYWLLNQSEGSETVEAYNRYLASKLNGDSSGWDVNQLLRVPDTLNHKYDPAKPVELVKLERQIWQPPPIESLAKPEPLQLEGVENVAEVLLRHTLSPRIKELLGRHPIELFDRSAALFHLGKCCSESGLTAGETYSILEYADSKWGKFSQRDDKQLRLVEIVRRVHEGFSATLPVLPESNPTQARLSNDSPVGVISLIEQSEDIRWAVEGMIRHGGMTLIIGETGEGKSVFGMNMTLQLALGADKFLDFPIHEKKQKVLYASHEMDRSELKSFMGAMIGKFPTARERLEERFHVSPFGYTIPLDQKQGQDLYEEYFKTGEYTGFVVDTLTSSLSTETNEKAVGDFVRWVQRMQAKYGIWVLVLHHIRKEQVIHKRKNRDITLSDSFGSRLIINIANEVFVYEKRRLKAVKNRHGRKGEIGLVFDAEHNWLTVGSLPVEGEKLSAELPPEITDGNVDQGPTEAFS